MDRAVALMCIGATLTGLAAVLSIVLVDSGDSWSLSVYSSSDGRRAAEIAGYVGTLITLPLPVAFWLWLAWANAKGKSWARTVAMVLVILRVAFFIPNVLLMTVVDVFGTYRSTPALAVGVALQVIEIAVGVGAVWMMYRPESTAFYAASATPRFLPPYPPHVPYQPPPWGSGPSHGPAPR
jgi:hypothetical protein